MPAKDLLVKVEIIILGSYVLIIFGTCFIQVRKPHFHFEIAKTVLGFGWNW